MILITGGAGYIGTYVAKLIEEHVILDNLSNSEAPKGLFYNGDIRDKAILNEIFTNYNIDLVIHLAAKKDVSESVLNPLDYYDNNVLGTLTLLKVMKEHKVEKIIFASTAAMYNDGIASEEDIPNPKTPYASTKLICEDIIKVSGLKYVIFRFFNVAGHDKNGIMLIQRIKQGEQIIINGNDYNTQDGTCIRDYVSVDDIALAILKGIEYLKTNNKGLFNLGTNKGYTIKEICDIAKCPYSFGPRRESDVIVSIANNKRAQEVLGWIPTKTLQDILKEE